MPTKYDVFAKLIEKAPCKESELDFKRSVYTHLQELIRIGWVKVHNNKYTPIKNTKTKKAFAIIKYCIKNNLDYNTFFSRNMPKIMNELIEHTPNIRPPQLKNNKDILQILNYLEQNQFILVHNKRPAKGTISRHQLFDSILELNSIQKKIAKPKYSCKIVAEKIRKIKATPLNPFDEQAFSFLAGSAQLEGATISVEETRELLTKDIYPDKPQKDIQMVKNLNEALHYIIEQLDEEITEEHIKQINYLVMFSMHRNAGKYKRTQNKIQGNPSFKTTPPNKVKQEIDNYINKIKHMTPENCLENIGKIHNDLQRIHPFADGNSRTTRMILNWILAKNKLPIIVLKMGAFDEYMKLTKLSTKREDEELTQFFWNVLVHEDLMK